MTAAPRLLIYGATGFTGRLIVDEALAFGLRPVLAGRSRQKLEALARPYGLDARCAPLDDPKVVHRMLDGVSVVLNAAGPFRATALPLARACLERGAHYLDVSGEIAAVQALVALDAEAKRRDVMIMPAVGFDVVPTDCMAAGLVQQLPSATELVIGFTGLDHVSRGSAESVLEQYEELVTVRRAGRLVRVAPGELERDFDFGYGPVRTTAITWGDVVTAYHSTGVPNITVYYEATSLVRAGLNMNRYAGWLLRTSPWKWWLKTAARSLPDGPTAVERARGRALIVARAVDDQGRSAQVRLDTPEVYSFTATSSIAIADRVLHADWIPGFQTPARVYGPDFVLSLPGVRQTRL